VFSLTSDAGSHAAAGEEEEFDFHEPMVFDMVTFSRDYMFQIKHCHLSQFRLKGTLAKLTEQMSTSYTPTNCNNDCGIFKIAPLANAS